MLTPVELQNKTFKSGGLGYDKKDVEQFFREVTDEFTRLYSENVDLKDRVDALNDALQRYKTMENTLQKALVLAQKTAEDTTQAAVKNARNIEKEAQLKSQIIMADARNELERVHAQTIAMLQQFEKYKAQVKSLAVAQVELLESDSYSINAERLEAFIDTSRTALPRSPEQRETGAFQEARPIAPTRTGTASTSPETGLAWQESAPTRQETASVWQESASARPGTVATSPETVSARPQTTSTRPEPARPVRKAESTPVRPESVRPARKAEPERMVELTWEERQRFAKGYADAANAAEEADDGEAFSFINL